MVKIDYQDLKRDDEYVEHLGTETWLMDNHKWALWIWERYAADSSLAKFTLAHADHHWDGGYDFFENPEEEAEMLAADLDGLHALIAEGEWIRYDSFIAPVVVRGRFDAVHFFCKQDNGGDIGIGEEVLAASGATQMLHPTAESLASIAPAHPLVFDLCLDLFNNESKMEYGSDLWQDEEVLAFLDTMRPLIESACLVTISLSFGCSGTPEDTKHLAELVVPRVLAWRAEQQQ
ncbi:MULTISPECIES: UPF0489 family protein [unclassified Variovorax]|uniref:UPF0489 family protein n=1 Tax=unclassified Variovorax TaxID=663243 RepID=UPI003F446BB8